MAPLLFEPNDKGTLRVSGGRKAYGSWP